ncbi:MAG: hypothetical protein WCS94_03485 [Verrucomicrobiota bacterium]
MKTPKPSANAAQTTPPTPAPPPPPLWRPNRESAYMAVQLGLEGKGTSQIAEIMYGSKSPTEIERVNSLFEFAGSRGFVSMLPPENPELQIQLQERYRGHIRFHVVNNDYAAYDDHPRFHDHTHADAVCHQAANVVATKIHELMFQRRSGDARPIVIANAGGRAVSRLVHFLGGQKRLPEEADPAKLLFISLNSASMPNEYGLSANTLTVRMAEIYGGRHIALCPVWPDEIRKAYETAVNHIDLLICGAGARHGILFTWLDNHAKINLPGRAVGDVCLIPITAQGDEVPLIEKAPERIRKILNPHPTYSALQTLAAQDGVVFIPTGGPRDDGRQGKSAGASGKHSKLEVTRAILDHSLTRTCVLGATLARDLLESP